MNHIGEEEIALLVDTAATTAQARHLQECTVCRARLAAHRRQLHDLRALPDLAAPDLLWARVHRELSAPTADATRRRPSAARSLTRVAAAILIFGAGAATGRLSGRSPATSTPAAPAAEPLPTAASAPDNAARVAMVEIALITTRAALNDAPGDPVIRERYAAAVRDRDQVLQRVAVAGAGARWF